MIYNERLTKRIKESRENEYLRLFKTFEYLRNIVNYYYRFFILLK